jgi:hypothetical protein
MSHRILTLMRMGENKEPILDTNNNNHDDKIPDANKLREKIIGVKETLERQGIEWNLHTLQN